MQVLSPWHFNQMLEVRSNDQPASWLQRGISFTSILLTLWDEKQKTEACKALLRTLTLTYLQTGWPEELPQRGEEAAENQTFIHRSIHFNVAHINNIQ